jgi:acyl carrier protein
MEAVRERVNRVIARQFQVGPDRVTDGASIDEDLRATSLDRVELVMTLEDEFAISISDGEAAELRSVGDVLVCVAANLGRLQPLQASARPATGDERGF